MFTDTLQKVNTIPLLNIVEIIAFIVFDTLLLFIPQSPATIGDTKPDFVLPKNTQHQTKKVKQHLQNVSKEYQIPLLRDEYL